MKHAMIGFDDRGGPRRIHCAKNIGAGDLATFDRDQAVSSQAINMAPGYADIDGVNNDAGDNLSLLHGFPHRGDGVFYVDDHALTQAA